MLELLQYTVSLILYSLILFSAGKREYMILSFILTFFYGVSLLSTNQNWKKWTRRILSKGHLVTALGLLIISHDIPQQADLEMLRLVLILVSHNTDHVIESKVFFPAKNLPKNSIKTSENEIYISSCSHLIDFAWWNLNPPSATGSPTYYTPLFSARWQSPATWALNPFSGQKMPRMKHVPSNRWDWTAGGQTAQGISTVSN